MRDQASQSTRAGSLGDRVASCAAPWTTVKAIEPPELLKKVLHADAP